MAEDSGVVFGAFTPSEVTDLYRTESNDLEFGWQRKKVHCLQNSVLKTPQKLTPQKLTPEQLTPESLTPQQVTPQKLTSQQLTPQQFTPQQLTPRKLTPRSYSPEGGSISPNIPRNPPTTPVDSRSASPSPLPLSRLNANAPPFVPSTSPEEPASPEAGGRSRAESGGGGLRTPLSGTETENGTVTEESLAPPTTQMTCVPNSTPECAEGSSTPIQTVGVPTPSLTEAHPTEGGSTCRDGQPVAPPCTSTSDTTSDTAHSSHNSTPHSPLNTHPQPHQSHTSPSQSRSSPAAVLPVSLPEAIGRADPTNDTPTPPHKAHNLQGTHHTSTVTNSTTHTPKTWASIVSRSGSNQVHVGTSASVEEKSEGVREGKGEGVREGKGEGVKEGGGERESAEVAGSVTSSQPSSQSPHLQSLGDQLRRMCVSHTPISLQPRGLVNQGNWCYMHAPLQALISIPEICHLLRCLNSDPPLSVTPSDTPLTDTLTQFIQEFSEYHPQPPSPAPSVKPGGGKKKRSVVDIVCGAPFRPDGVYDLLRKIHTPLSTKGRQEDAEEFLCCVLSGLHEEMVAAQTAVGQGAGGEGEEEGVGEEEGKERGGGGGEGEWEQVGPKNKSTITRQTSFNESPVSDVLGGELRSVLQRQGAKESATVEPFFSLQLDIQSKEVWSVQDALVGLATREPVQMHTGTQNEIDAHRRLSLARLPVVLVLHLKRFLFDKTGGSQKMMKPVQYSMDLEVGRDLLAPTIRSKLTTAQRTYKLWAVVYHHGKSAVGGHYTCDVRHTGIGAWLRIDDSYVKPLPEEAIVRQSQASNKVAYLLFYRRSDCIRTM